MTDRNSTTDGFEKPAPAGATRPDDNRPPESAAEARRRTDEKVRALVAEYHARLPRDQAAAVGAAYARFSSRFQDSIPDQIRTVLEDAVRKRVFIPLEHVFYDLAVRGCKSDREGLNALRACLDRKAASVVFFFATNRLFRKTYRSLQFVEERLVEKGVRAVFVKSGIDTADGQRWRGLLSMNAMMDEFVVGMTADHVRAAHEGLLDRRLVFGTLSFGYCGTPLDGQTTRRGRPRMALAIDPVAGPWVERIFAWYVADQVPMAEIVRRLTPTRTPRPRPNRRIGPGRTRPSAGSWPTRGTGGCGGTGRPRRSGCRARTTPARSPVPSRSRRSRSSCCGWCPMTAGSPPRSCSPRRRRR